MGMLRVTPTKVRPAHYRGAGLERNVGALEVGPKQIVIAIGVAGTKGEAGEERGSGLCLYRTVHAPLGA